MSKVLVSETNLVAIGDAIREKNGESTKYKPGEMAAAISAITTGGGGGEAIEIPVITGDCQYRFAYDGWTWAIDAFGDQMRTENINRCTRMFQSAYNIEKIPFDINCKPGTEIDLSYMFSYCWKLKEIPKFNNCKPSNIQEMFSNCFYIRYLPEDMDTWFDWSGYDNATSAYSCYQISGVFYSCESLRNIPMGMLEHENSLQTSYFYTIYSKTFDSCWCVDEIIGVPIHSKWILNAVTSNLFDSTFRNCLRAKDITFKDYGTDTIPVRPVKWKNQTIDLTVVGYNIGYGITGKNSGITLDKEVYDDTTYQALKNDPDWYARNMDYSRYNHDSAVRTINSLPDTSTYLATAGGTNTIKFKGAAGAKTDGGAINTLTDAEIAVATARGWTVSLV